MDTARHDLITAFHQAGYRCVLALTGGGAGAASLLLSVPGSSRSLLEAIIPYDEQSLIAFLGRTPQSFCTRETAQLMARRALERARWLAAGQQILGAACTASLKSDRPKHGDHRFHLAFHTDHQARAYSLTLVKGARSREEEEDLLDTIFLNCLAETVGLKQRISIPLLEGETLQNMIYPQDSPLAALFGGQIPAVLQEIDGTLKTNGRKPNLLLSGSFNPVHKGHCFLAKVAADLVGSTAAFELGIVNADKPPLTEEEVRRRMAQFTWLAPLYLSRAPTFIAKAELFPGTIFVVGADTAERILQARFYGESEAQRDQALRRFRELGCRFLVAARLNTEGTVVGCKDIPIPASYSDLFTPIPTERFRIDLSSTQLRAALT